MFKLYSIISPNGYVVNFDTQKRRKYTKEQESKVLDCNRWGLTIRETARSLSIPPSSIYNILKRSGKVKYKDQKKPNLSWLSRDDCMNFYDMTSASFDYVKKNHPQYSLTKGGKVFVNCKYINDYYFGKKGYENSRFNSRKDLKY